jgi:hypothetical protein
MANARNLSTLAQGASTAGILAGTYGGTGASLSPTTAGNTIFTTDGTNWSSTQKIVRGTSVATTSGTAIDFTSIPSWVKRITVMFSGVSTNGTSQVLVQIGAGSVTTTGYTTVGAGSSSAPSIAMSAATTNGFVFQDGMAAIVVISGPMYISSFGSNTWVSSAVVNRGSSGGTSYMGWGAGNVTLSGTLDRIRLTTANGTDTFDAGSVNILYE